MHCKLCPSLGWWTVKRYIYIYFALEDLVWKTCTGFAAQRRPASCFFDSGSPLQHTQDALERAYSKDVEGWRLDAIKLYRIGVDAIQEGLALRVPSPGLGPAFSNVARWREDMKQWLQRANDRRGATLLPVTWGRLWDHLHSILQAHFQAAAPRLELRPCSTGEEPHLRGAPRRPLLVQLRSC